MAEADETSNKILAASQESLLPTGAVGDSTVPVDVRLLDSLMRLVGELVLTRNQIVSFAVGLREPTLVRASQRLDLIASELQADVMKTRMQPIENLWDKLPPVVAELARSAGRAVALEMAGQDTLLDKTVLEAIKGPVTELVTNAIDHGVEPSEVRVAAGKGPQGVLRLRAFHDSGQVNIEITDDGAGLLPDQVADRALQRGLVSAVEVSRMQDADKLDLVFVAGMSAVGAPGEVSGPATGLAGVKGSIETIGGSIGLVTEPGAGTTFHVRIPLTLAIIPAVTIECAGDRYAIPQVSLVELVSQGNGSGARAIENLCGAPVYRLRGRLLPLVSLHEALGLGLGNPADTGADVTIAVLQADGQQFGLVVDRVLGTEEIVVKPLSVQLKRISEYAGATILGDGRVALILDVLSLARNSNVFSTRTDAAELDPTLVTDQDPAGEAQLVLGLGEDRRIAVPLSAVTRLEEFPVTAIEHVGGREVVQYRGQILPLLRLAEHLGAYGTNPAETLQVVVYAEAGRSIGLVVDQVLDITQDAGQARCDLDSHGVLGSAVIQDKVTELLDVRSAILAADPRFFTAPTPPALATTGDRA